MANKRVSTLISVAFYSSDQNELVEVSLLSQTILY